MRSWSEIAAELTNPSPAELRQQRAQEESERRREAVKRAVQYFVIQMQERGNPEVAQYELEPGTIREGWLAGSREEPNWLLFIGIDGNWLLYGWHPSGEYNTPGTPYLSFAGSEREANQFQILLGELLLRYNLPFPPD